MNTANGADPNDGKEAAAGDPSPPVAPAPSDIPDLMPARMLNEFAYCPRLFYFEFVQCQFVDSADTIEGRLRHKRVDTETGDVPEAAAKAEGNATAEAGLETQDGEPVHARSVMLSAPKAGLIARIDLLEGNGHRVSPVDYKRGAAPDIPERAWEPDRVQLCAQGIILRENGYTCDEGVVYYAASKTRVTIQFDDDLVRRTFDLLRQARKTADDERIPLPLVDSPKCPRCSLVAICLPDETHALCAKADAEPPREVRRLLPARDDSMPLYVQAQGGRVGKSGDRLSITPKDGPKQTVRILDVSQVNLFGNVQVSTQAIRELAQRGVPISYFSYGGWFNAITTGLTHKNVELRRRQFTIAEQPDRAMALARAFILGKVKNGRTLLRRNHEPKPKAALRDLNDLRDRIAEANTPATLLGLEGNAARIYFKHFSGMLKRTTPDLHAFDFNGRNRRPPRDPVNALLSFAYALLVKDLTVTVMAVGFDPFLGFFHRPRYGRPALALDLAEEFRPIVADSVVLQALNNGEVRQSDFIMRAGACALRPAGRRRFIETYHRRLDKLVTHPIFGYTISYRRILEVQARLLAAHLHGELPEYAPFCTR